MDGFRVDVANSMVKDPGPAGPRRGRDDRQDGNHPYLDRDGVHDVFRAWRAISDSYDPPRVSVAEAWVPAAERGPLPAPGRAAAAFNFNFLRAAGSRRT